MAAVPFIVTPRAVALSLARPEKFDEWFGKFLRLTYCHEDSLSELNNGPESLSDLGSPQVFPVPDVT